VRDWIRAPNPKSSHSPIPGTCWFFARRGRLSRPRGWRRREVLTAAPSSLIIAAGGMGADRLRSRVLSGSCWPSLRIRLCLAGTVGFASRPASIRTRSGRAGRLLDGVPRFGGALLSLRRSQLDQGAQRSQPHSDGYALPQCQFGLLSPCHNVSSPSTLPAFDTCCLAPSL
jgi:hypothetical protein